MFLLYSSNILFYVQNEGVERNVTLTVLILTSIKNNNALFYINTDGRYGGVKTLSGGMQRRLSKA